MINKLCSGNKEERHLAKAAEPRFPEQQSVPVSAWSSVAVRNSSLSTNCAKMITDHMALCVIPDIAQPG